MTPRALIALVAIALVAAAVVLAVADPLGWRRAPAGLFAVEASRAVQTPTAPRIDCLPADGQSLRCGTSLPGHPYRFVSQVIAPTRSLDRSAIQNGVNDAAAHHRLTSQQSQQISRDLAAIPSSFLPNLDKAALFATLSPSLTPLGNQPRVPPAAVPGLLVCATVSAGISCRDLDGDAHTPSGSAVYQAVPSADWRPAPTPRADPSIQLYLAIFGDRALTPPEFRLLRDLLQTCMTPGARAPIRSRCAYDSTF